METSPLKITVNQTDEAEAGSNAGLAGGMALVEEVGWPGLEIEVKISGPSDKGSSSWGLRIEPEAVAALIKTLGRSELAWGGSEMSWQVGKKMTSAGPAIAMRSLMELTQALVEQSATRAGLRGSAEERSMGVGRHEDWLPERSRLRESLTARVGIRAEPPTHQPSSPAALKKAGEEMMGAFDEAFAHLGVKLSKTMGAPKGRAPKPRLETELIDPVKPSDPLRGGCCYLELENEWLASWIRPENWERARQTHPWAKALGKSEWAVATAFRCSPGLAEVASMRAWSFSSLKKNSWTLSGVHCDWNCPEEEYRQRLDEFFGEGAASAPERVAKRSGDEYAREGLLAWSSLATEAYPARAEAEALRSELGEKKTPSKSGPKGL